MDKFTKKWFSSKKTKNTTTTSVEGKNKIRVVFKCNAHCKHCNTELERCIKKYSKGISSVVLDTDLTVAVVEGVFDVGRLSEHIFQRVSKRVQVVSQETLRPVVGSSSKSASETRPQSSEVDSKSSDTEEE